MAICQSYLSHCLWSYPVGVFRIQRDPACSIPRDADEPF